MFAVETFIHRRGFKNNMWIRTRFVPNLVDPIQGLQFFGSGFLDPDHANTSANSTGSKGSGRQKYVSREYGISVLLLQYCHSG
jgi:hypothetical protein